MNEDCYTPLLVRVSTLNITHHTHGNLNIAAVKMSAIKSVMDEAMQETQWSINWDSVYTA